MSNLDTFYRERSADASAVRHQAAEERVLRKRGRIQGRPRNVPQNDTPRVFQTDGAFGMSTLTPRARPSGPSRQENVASAVKAGTFDTVRQAYNDRNAASGYEMDGSGNIQQKPKPTAATTTTGTPPPPANQANPPPASPSPIPSRPRPNAPAAAAPATTAAATTLPGSAMLAPARGTGVNIDPALWTPEAIAKSNPTSGAPLPTHPNDLRGPLAPRPNPATQPIADRNASANDAIARSKALRATVDTHVAGATTNMEAIKAMKSPAAPVAAAATPRKLSPLPTGNIELSPETKQANSTLANTIRGRPLSTTKSLLPGSEVKANLGTPSTTIPLRKKPQPLVASY